MKKSFIAATLALGAAISAHAAIPNIYACGLGLAYANGEHVFSYSLNTAATSVDIEIYDLQDNLLATYPSTGLAQGENTFTVKIKETGSFYWKLKATAASTAEQSGPVATRDDSKTAYPGSDLAWSRLRSIAVNDNPWRSDFGSVYATNCGASANFDGLLKFSNCMVPDNGGKSYRGGVSWNGQSSPNDVYVAQDGKLYLSDWSDKNSGVYVADNEDLSANFSAVFVGSRAGNGLVTSVDDVAVCGSASTCCTKGEDEELVLYTFDEDLDGGGLYRYDLGTTDLPWNSAPTKKLGRTFTFGGEEITISAGACARVRWDKRDGLWLCHSVAGTTTLLHFNGNDEVDFCQKISNVTENAACGFAVNHDGSYLAISNGKYVHFYDVEFSEAGVPSIAEDTDEKISTGVTNLFGLAFDYAMNLYIASTGNGIYVYAMPKADNTCSVRSCKSFSDGQVVGVDDVAVADDEAIEAVYTLTGAAVAADIDALAPGVYIVKTNVRTYKIVK